MSEQSRHNRSKSFPKEWEFKRTFENVEDIYAGKDKVRNPDLSSPFNLFTLVDDVRRAFPLEDNLQGTLYVKLRNQWFDHYEPKQAISKTLSPPPENQ